MKNVIFIAPPAAGKGTISEYLVNKYNYKYISTGDILRNIVKENSKLGTEVKRRMEEGELIGDDIILPLFKEELLKIKEEPFILDGMPRNLEQGKYLDDLFNELNVNNYRVINIVIESDLLEKRVTGRRICSSCKKTYNIFFDEFKPLTENICNHCGSPLISRGDDNLETFKTRIEKYKLETEPLIKYYKEKNKLTNVEATKPQTEIIRDVEKIIEDNQ